VAGNIFNAARKEKNLVVKIRHELGPYSFRTVCSQTAEMARAQSPVLYDMLRCLAGTILSQFPLQKGVLGIHGLRQ
jgi:hypothetical protein